MPRNELCSSCYIRRLAMMQASPYSVYNDFYQTNLEYVYLQCGGKGPTTIQPRPQASQTPVTTYCATNLRYTTAAGDTCDSIASKSKVSTAALYMANQDAIRECKSVPAGLSLCIPFQCTTYTVQANDPCIGIELSLKLGIGAVSAYNSWINEDCSNLQTATDWYGKTICVSPQGGSHTVTVSPPGPTSSGSAGPGGPGSGTGSGSGGDTQYRVPVAPPTGVTVAKGTTLGCGKWHVVANGEDCGTM